MSSEVNPALVAAIVDQVLSALQHMKIGGPGAIESNDNMNGRGTDAEDDDYIVQFSSPPPSPAPGSVPETTTASIAAVSTPVGEPAAIPSVADAGAASATLAPPPHTAPVVTVPSTAHNAAQASHGSWYMVSTGLAVGAFRGWHIISPLVIGVSGACFKKYPSEATALAAFEEAQAAGVVNTVV